MYPLAIGESSTPVSPNNSNAFAKPLYVFITVEPITQLPINTPKAKSEQTILPTIFTPFSAATDENLAAIQIDTIVDIKKVALAILAVCSDNHISDSIIFLQN
jgi:hypothetical protein